MHKWYKISDRKWSEQQIAYSGRQQDHTPLIRLEMSLDTSVHQHPAPDWSKKVMPGHMTWIMTVWQRGEPMAWSITWPLFEYWCCLRRHGRSALPVLLLCDIVWLGPSPQWRIFWNQSLSDQTCLRCWSRSRCARGRARAAVVWGEDARVRLRISSLHSSVWAPRRGWAALCRPTSARPRTGGPWRRRRSGGGKLRIPGRLFLQVDFARRIPPPRSL